MRLPGGRQAWYVAASAAVSVGVIGYLLTVVSPGEIVRSVRSASVPGLLAYAALSLLSTVFRNERYVLLARAAGAGVSIGRWQMLLVTFVRNLFADLLPARIGSTVYIVVLRTRFGYPVDAGTSIWALAFLLDMVVMVPLMAIGVAMVGGWRLGVSPVLLAAVATAFFLASVAALPSLPYLLRAAGRAGARLCPLPLKRAAGEGVCARTADRVERIARVGLFGRALWLSFIVRALKYACLMFLVYAILNPIDPAVYTLHRIGFWPVFVGASLAELSASTPVSGIGGFGAYEGVWAGAFYLLGYPKDLAVLSGVSAHVITQVFGYTLGALALAVLGAPFLRRREAPR